MSCIGMKIEEYDAILELSKQWLYRKYENYVTFLKNCVTPIRLKVLNFVLHYANKIHVHMGLPYH
jgi:hypothetical protein